MLCLTWYSRYNKHVIAIYKPVKKLHTCTRIKLKNNNICMWVIYRNYNLLHSNKTFVELVNSSKNDLVIKTQNNFCNFKTSSFSKGTQRTLSEASWEKTWTYVISFVHQMLLLLIFTVEVN